MSANVNNLNHKKVKCSICNKNILKRFQLISCDTCGKYFDLKCSRVTKDVFTRLTERAENWDCTKCISILFPYSNIDNDKLYFEIIGKSLPDSDQINFAPSFSIQSLLDQFLGQNFDTDEFLSDTISFKYYTPSESVQNKLPNDTFTMLHINVASLGKHIDELRSLLNILNYPFDIIGITETRLYEECYTTNIDLEGCNFRHTHTHRNTMRRCRSVYQVLL